ncbi:hypothetical protein CYMTET_12649 [Cymbomonas tetramitiformis]|uniref:site-specific DNA-methyltransferase (cytosine-N(4)-specific) n=1 Tax=Cymbomonas tetramitiformis TaxID=36881 RepID=A0AAE0GK21_9CHLO|nr:hypothetical protein CYMTET_12649 [Cymbomonas tetramitiformis]|eukprot:gene5504-6667_t
MSVAEGNGDLGVKEISGGDTSKATFPSVIRKDEKCKWVIDTDGDPELTEVLGDSLHLLWQYGFPQTPNWYPRLSHGFHYYLAGMQATTAAKLLEVLPGEKLLDPFVGGGCVAIEGMRAGRRTYGADLSPLAVFITKYHTWRPTPDQISAYVAITQEIQDTVPHEKAPGGQAADWRHPIWATLTTAIAERAVDVDEELRGALWFTLSATLERARKFGKKRSKVVPIALFGRTARHYMNDIQALIDTVPEGVHQPQIVRCDARELQLAEEDLVDAVLTSPPYPAVYDYLSTARQIRSRSPPNIAEVSSGMHFDSTVVPEGRVWPEGWHEGEIGARKAMRRDPTSFQESWQCDTEAWMLAMKNNMKVGARAVINIGDGDDSFICALQSIKTASNVVGLKYIASATIRSREDIASKKRVEHAILLEK